MSQARVTDFFSRRRKGGADVRMKAAQQRGRGPATRSRGPATRSSSPGCPSSVHREFVQVIDEAAGLNDVETAAAGTATSPPASPRTPKRTSADAEFDLGAVVFSAAAIHSTAKKSRHREPVPDRTVPERATRRAARKKLVLPSDPPPSTGQTRTGEVSLPHTGPAAAPLSVAPASGQSSDSHVGPVTRKTLCKEDVAALKSCIQRIKKHAEEITRTTAVPTVLSCSASADPSPDNTNSPVPKTTTFPDYNAKDLKITVARAKHLAVKVQRGNKGREAEKSKQSEAQTHSTQQPAYQRYHNLAQAAAPGLSLPYQFKVLAEMFRSMDTVVAMLYNRCETTTFAKVKKGVQDMMHRRFEESHLGQIKTVFPEAYTFRQEKNIPNFNSSNKTSYQLTIEPVVFSEPSQVRTVMSAICLLERRQIFHHNLISIVKQHHKEFMASLVPQVSVPEDKLTRWHPRFNVDTVPPILISSLPQPPHTEKLVTAQEVLDKARSVITPKMKKALASLVLKTQEVAAESKEPMLSQNTGVLQTSGPPAAAAVQVPAALKGVSQALLDRIRAREAEKLQATMMRNPSQEERLLMMSRLGELARILRSVFVAEKKPALIMEVACNMMIASYRSALTMGEMEKHVRLLAEVAAEWLTIHPIRKDIYLKLNKNMELSVVLDRLSRRLKEEEKL